MQNDRKEHIRTSFEEIAATHFGMSIRGVKSLRNITDGGYDDPHPDAAINDCWVFYTIGRVEASIETMMRYEQ